MNEGTKVEMMKGRRTKGRKEERKGKKARNEGMKTKTK